MYKYILLTFCISLLFINCSKNNTSISFEVARLQRESKKVSKDSSYIFLLSSKKILDNSSGQLDSLKAENNYLLGLYHQKNANLDSADFYFYKATNFKETSIESSRAPIYYYSAWVSKKTQGKTGDCIELSQRFYNTIDKKDNFDNLNFAFYLLQNSFENANKIDSASYYANQRTRLLKKQGDTTNIIKVYISLSKLLYKQQKVDSAFAILDKLIIKESQLSDDTNRQLFGQYGVFLFKENEPKQAILFYKKALINAKKTSDSIFRKNHIANSYGNLAEANIAIRRYDIAQKYIDSIYQLNFPQLSYENQKNTLTYQLLLSYNSKKDFSKIKNQMTALIDFQEEKYNEKFSTELIALSEANFNEKQLIEANKKKEIQNINLKNRNILVFSFFIFLAAIGILFFRQRTLKYEKQSLQFQQRLLRSQMNPHFTFNTIYAIQNSIKKSPELASNYLLRFSKLLRLIFENSTDNYISLEKEIKLITEYLELQQFRFPGKFNYKIDTNKIDEDLYFIPPMLIQPFVENTIEHGFKNIDYNGDITLKFRVNNTFVHCIIEDNGIGYDFSKNNTEKVSSIQLISTFIEKTTKTKISIINKSNDIQGGKGTIISFNIPFKLTKND